MDIRCLGEATGALGEKRASLVRVECGPVGIGFSWVKATDKVEHVLVHTIEVTSRTDELPNVTQVWRSHPQ